MRVSRPVLPFLSACFILTSSLLAQNTSTSPAQAINSLQGAVLALGGRSALGDVTLTGTVEWIAGADVQNGTATLKALPEANRLDMAFSRGTRSEIRGNGPDGPTGTWVGPDGIAHSISDHNLMIDPGWFPLFALENINSSASSLVTYVGTETRNGAPVIHLSASQQFPGSAGNVAILMQHLTQVDIYLDPSSLLPVSYVFNMHPDNDAGLDIPAEIRYSSYQSIGGVQIPFHVQKFVNNTLTLDLHVQNASLNTGITAAQIGAL